MKKSNLRTIGCAWVLGALTAAGCAETKPAVTPPAAPVVAAPVEATPPAPPAPTAAPSAEPVSAVTAPVETGPRETPPDLAALRQIRDAQGGVGLLAELKRLPSDPGAAFAFQKRVFDLIRDLRDPGAADALAAFAAQKPHPYFETRAALALAALGDLRAVPFLARRLRLDPLETYGDTDWEMRLKRSDQERVNAARMLADLASIHPEARASMTAQAEDALWFWLKETPSPHANGLRAVASLNSHKNITQLRAWSNPQQPLPIQGQQPPMPEEWVIAQTGLRYIGKLQDAPSFPVLLRALERRPKNRDVTMNGLGSGGIAILGMTLRALGIGAADGLAEWGDARAFKPLLKHVEDPLNNEHSRLAAGAALGWVGTDQDLQQLAKRVAQSPPQQDLTLSLSLLEAFDGRLVNGVAAELLPLLNTSQSFDVRGRVARILARQPLDPATESQLTTLLQTPDLKADAALALLLGGSKQAAINVVASYGKQATPSIEQLKDVLGRAVGALRVSPDDVANGTLLRYVENTEAVAATMIRREPQVFARQLLGNALENLEFDNGPHTATRVVLADQLGRLARGSDQRLAGLAIRALMLMNEPGRLLALTRGKAAVAVTDAARIAYSELLNSNAAKPDVPTFE